MKQTAVEWLVQKLSKEWQLEERDLHLIEQAKEMEKEQIIDSFEQGDMVGRSAIIRGLEPNDKVVLKYPEISAEQYYSETFKSE